MILICMFSSPSSFVPPMQIPAVSTLVHTATWCKRRVGSPGRAMPQRRRQGAALLFGEDRQHYKVQKRMKEQTGQTCSSESEDTVSDEADGRKSRQSEDLPSLVSACPDVMRENLDAMRENAGHRNSLPEQMKTLVAIRVHKAQTAIAHIHGIRYVGKEAYAKKKKEINDARMANDEAMTKMRTFHSSDIKQGRDIGKLVRSAMLIVENTFAKMWEDRSGHDSLFVLGMEANMTSDAFKFHWDKALKIMVEVKIIVLELVGRVEAEEQQAIDSLAMVTLGMTTAMSGLFDVQTAMKSREPCLSQILIDLDISERLVMRICESNHVRILQLPSHFGINALASR